MLWWEVLVQQTINGLTRGAVFGLIALGYTMVYGIIELINFAHGDVFMLGLFVSLSWFVLLGTTKTLTGWELLTILPLVFLLTMLTTAALNVTIDRVAYRPLRRSTRLAPLITAIGVSFMLENIALLWKGPAPIAYPDVFPSVDILREWFGVDSAIFVTTKDLLVIGATLPLMIALNYFVTRTRWGKAMRATAQDRETAQAMGINVERTILLTFFVGGALAGAAGLTRAFTTTSACGGWATRRACAPSPRPCSAASVTCRVPCSAASSSDSCRRGATSTSPRAGPTPSSSRS